MVVSEFVFGMLSGAAIALAGVFLAIMVAGIAITIANGKKR